MWKKIVFLIAAAAVVFIAFWQYGEEQKQRRLEDALEVGPMLREAVMELDAAMQANQGRPEAMPRLWRSLDRVLMAKYRVEDLEKRTERLPLVSSLLDKYAILLPGLERRQQYAGQDATVPLTQVRHDLELLATALSPLGLATWDDETFGPEWKKIVDQLTCEEVLNVYLVDVPPEWYSRIE